MAKQHGQLPSGFANRLSGPSASIMWMLAVAALGGVLAGWWYWNAHPASVQGAIVAARTNTHRTDVMTVEAIAEAGAEMVGRHVSIVKARVSRVIGERTFWVAGSDGESLLVVADASQNAPMAETVLQLAAGQLVTLKGVLRRSGSAAPPSASVQLLATDVSRLRD